MDKEIALKNLVQVRDILKAHDIDYWLEAGTCLGAFREKDFIGHDTDIDVGIKAEDCADVGDLVSLFGSFLNGGFRIYHTFGDLKKGYEIALWKDGIKIDIFWFYAKGLKRWHGAWKNGGRNGDSDLIKLVFDNGFFMDFEKIEFKGYVFNVPNFTEKYLIARYGETWEIPNPKWRWDKDPKCIDNNFEI